MARVANLFIIMVLCCLMAACNDSQGVNTASSAPKIGVVDLNRLMRDSAPGKEGLKFIESRQSGLQAELDAIQDKLEKNPADEQAMRDLQRVYAASQQQIQTEGQDVVGALFDAIQGALNTFRAKNGYAMLIRMEALDSFDPALDVTNAVMEDVDKIKIDFSALPKSAPSAESSQKDGEKDSDAASSAADSGKDKQTNNANGKAKPDEAKPAAGGAEEKKEPGK